VAPAAKSKKAPTVFGERGPVTLAEIPEGRFKDQLQRLGAGAQAKALAKLTQLRVPFNDVASLQVDGRGNLFYECLPPEHSESVEAQAPENATTPHTPAAASVPVAAPPVFHSRPGATRVIYLDFNGHEVTGTAWNDADVGSGRPAVASYLAKAYDTDANPTTFSDAEQAAILNIWRRVAEDFRPFDVDVTTEEPAVFTNQTLRALITHGTDGNGVALPSSATAGGVAYLDIFNQAETAELSPAFIYYNSLYTPENVAEAVSHELGHNLGLSHDGTSSLTYYAGHGEYQESWAPIMGVAYEREMTQWSKGEYYDANNPQDDLAILASQLTYVADDAPADYASAPALALTGVTVLQAGRIETTAEVDTFRFTTGAGQVYIFTDPPGYGAEGVNGSNLDAGLELLDAAGTVIATSASGSSTAATINAWVNGGDYQIRVTGTGYATPLAAAPWGWTAYGSLGAYTLKGTIIDPAPVAPFFTQQPPAAMTAGDGTYRSIGVQASGNPWPAYQWQRRLAGSGDWVNLTDGGVFSDTTGNYLSISAVSLGMSGDQFRCVLTSSSGTATSNVTTLTVLPQAPQVYAQPQSRTVLPGTTATFTPGFWGSAPLTLEWRKNGTIIPGATAGTLTLTNVQPADEGSYTLSITNSWGSAQTSPANLTLITLPVFTLGPGSITATVGSTRNLSTFATSQVTPTYQWTKDGVPLAGATSATLVLADIQPGDAGSYALVATNPAGSATSPAGVVTVVPFPAPSISLGTQAYVQLGGAVSLSPGIYGTGPFTYQWYRNGTAIPGGTQATLNLSAVTLADLAEYFLAATNAAGTTLSQTIRVELTAPSPTAPSHHWLDAQEKDGVAFFLFANPAKIARYDLAAGSWLAAWTLPAAPRAFAIADDAIYVAYANTVVKHDRALGNPVTLVTSATAIRGLGLVGNLLVLTAEGTSPSYSVIYRTHDRTSGQLLNERSGTYSLNTNLSYSSTPGRLFGRTNLTSGTELRAWPVGADGVIGSEIVYSAFGPGFGRTWTLGGGEFVVEASGQVRRAIDLAPAGHLGRMVDDAISDGPALHYTMRSGRVTELDGAFRELRSRGLGAQADRFWLRDGVFHCFAQPAAAGLDPGVATLARTELAAPVEAPPVDPAGLAVWSPQVEADADGVVYLYSKLHRNVFRWDTVAWSYRSSLSLPNTPNLFALSSAQDRLYFEGEARQIRQRSLGEAAAGTQPFANAPERLTGLQTTDAHLLFSVQNDSSNAWSTHFTAGAGGQVLSMSNSHNYSSPAMTWSAVDRRMYYLRSGSPTDLLYEEVGESGALGSPVKETPYHGEYGFMPPIRVSPDGRRVVLGSGRVFETAGLTTVGTLPLAIDDAAWAGARLHTIRGSLAGTTVEVWSETDLSRHQLRDVPGVPLRLLAIKGDRILVITSVAGVPTFHLLEAGSLTPMNPAGNLLPPEIVAQSPDGPVSLGSQVQLWVTTRGGAVPSYQWQYRLPGAGWNDLNGGNGVLGARTAQLFIQKVPAWLAGASFRVVVANAGGSVTSGSLAVNVNGQAAVVEVAAGLQHTVFRRADGSVWTLGEGSAQQLGNASFDDSAVPLRVGQQAVQVGAGYQSSFWFKADGTLWVAGQGAWPGVGSPTLMPPRQVTGTFVAASHGDNHVLLLKADGTLWGVGSGYSGQLGADWNSSVTGLVFIASGVVDMEASGMHTFFIKADGTLWGMGNNSYGQLGDGTVIGKLAAVQLMTGVKAVRAGGDFTMFLKQDNTLWASGRNVNGSLGDGTTTDRLTPVQVATDVKSFAAGAFHSLFVKLDGTVWGTGYSLLGQLGDGITTNRLTPVQVATGGLQVAARSHFSLLLKTDGSLWGTGERGSGAIGQNTTGAQQLEWGLITAGFPVALEAPANVTASDGSSSEGVLVTWQPVTGATSYEVWRASAPDVAQATLLAAGRTTPFHLDAGSVAGTTYYYWVRTTGLSDSSAFAGGDAGVRGVPQLPAFLLHPQSRTVETSVVFNLTVDVTGDPFPAFQWQQKAVGDTDWSDLAEGYPHTGTHTAKLTVSWFAPERDGTQLRCVLTNTAGQVASDAATLTLVTPVPVITTPPASSSVPIGSSAGFFVYAYSASGVPTYQWKKDGVAIPAATNNSLSVPTITQADAGQYTVVVTNAGGSIESQPVVLTVVPAIAATRVAAGGGHSLFLQTQGYLRGMGANQHGQTGGFSQPAQVNVPHENANYPNLLAIAAGEFHSLILNAAGGVSGAGKNTFGQALGGNGIGFTAFSGAAAVAAGDNHSLVLQNTGTLFAIGLNASGQLGDGTTTNRSSQVQVATGINSMAAGASHSLWIKADGTLWATGANASGQLGDGSTTDRNSAVQVATGVKHVAAGASHTLFIKVDGTLWGMGSNAFGQLGVNAPVAGQALSAVLIATDVVACSAGGGHSAFIKGDGSLWTLGLNNFGQLGIPGDTTNHTEPTQVALNVATVSAGKNHTLYIDSAGAVWGMGNNDQRQLGLETSGTFTATPVRLWATATVPLPAVPAGATASDGLTSGVIRVTWYGVPGTLGYELWRGTSPVSTAATLIASRIDGLLYHDATATTGTTYYYWVKATNQAGSSAFSAYDGGYHAAAAGLPYVVNAPGNVTVQYGTSFQLHATANGTFPISYQWRKDGVPFGGIGTASSSSISVTYYGPAASFATAGDYDLVLSNSVGTVVSRPATVTVVKAYQNITSNAPSTQQFTTTPFALTSTSSSGLPVAYELISGPATLAGNQLTFTGTGVITIRVSQPGGVTHHPAESFNFSFAVLPRNSAIELSGLAAVYDGSPKPVTASSTPGGIPIQVTYDGASAPPSAVGRYTVLAEITDPLYQGSLIGILAIAPGGQTITFEPPASLPFTLAPVALSATATSGLPVSYTVLSGPATVTGSNLTLTGTGAVTIRARQSGNENFDAAVPVERVITFDANFDSWRLAKFTGAELEDPDISGPNAVYGHDGLSNLVKYALGLEPKTDATAGLPVLAATETEWTYLYVRPPGRTDITYALEVSTDLVNWNTAGVTLAMTGSTETTESWRASYPQSLASRVFFRLRVTR
jgi:alpha-tubulin suppressor-like RCC1 family protein